MPELPDITIYLEALTTRLKDEVLVGVRLKSPFLLRSFAPPISAVAGKRITSFSRMGKRIVINLKDDLHLVIHLMIAGRLQWQDKIKAPLTGKISLAAFDFDKGTLLFTEVGTKQRASLHVVGGSDNLKEFDRGGTEPLTCSAKEFAATLRAENHTLKRALTDPTLFSGIGNAYSDEILHCAKMSPVKLTSRMDDAECDRLYDATQKTLLAWTDKLRRELGSAWPKKVTAFRDGMAVHGRYGQPCPVCATPVQRIAYADNETNYCPTCQTEGKLLADRSLSKLLRGDWPKTLAELEERKDRLRRS